jgi:16S rRNA (guanine527-N7)-methyltransferase
MHTALNSVLEKGLLRLEELDPDIPRIFGNREETILSILNKYIEEIEYFNPVYKLVGTQNRQELVVKHILDSLSPLGIIIRRLEAQKPAAVPAGAQEPRSIADVGSGAV